MRSMEAKSLLQDYIFRNDGRVLKKLRSVNIDEEEKSEKKA